MVGVEVQQFFEGDTGESHCNVSTIHTYYVKVNVHIVSHACGIYTEKGDSRGQNCIAVVASMQQNAGLR